MKTDTTLGVVSILFGISSFIVMFGAERKQLIFENADNFFLKYILIVFSLNAGEYFLLMGMLLLQGKVVSYFSDRHSPKNQAKLDIIVITAMIPTLICFTGLIVISSRFTLTASWLLFLCFLVWVLVARFKTLIKNA